MEYFFQIHSHKKKFIFSLISSILYQMGSSIVTTIGSFCVYFVSYIYYKDSWVNMQYGNINGPIILLLLSSFSPLSGVIEKKIGPKLTLILSSSIVECCLILFYFQRNLWIFYGLSICIGIGSGLSAGVPIKNSCRYYPNKKGVINSVIICLGGLVSSLYSFIGEKIINPDKKGIINKKTNPFYPEEVANNANKFFIFAMIVFPVINLLSLFFFYIFVPNNDNKDSILVEKKGKENNNTNTKEIVKTYRFWRNIMIIGLMPFWTFFLMSTYRAYAPMIGVDRNLVSYLNMIILGLNSITGLIWAFIFDKFGFQIIIKIMSGICIILSIYFIIFIDDSVLYVIGLIVNTAVSRVGIMSVFNPHIMQVFEFRNYLIIGGFARLFNQSSSFIAALTSVLLSITYSTGEELQKPYKIVAGIGLILSCVGFILSFQENDEKFLFKNDEEIQNEGLGVDTIRDNTDMDKDNNE